MSSRRRNRIGELLGGDSARAKGRARKFLPDYNARVTDVERDKIHSGWLHVVESWDACEQQPRFLDTR